MSHIIVNLTLPIVVAKVETVLRDPEAPSHWEALDVPDFRQRLTAYVLRRLPVIYVTLDQDTIRRTGTPSECYSYEQHRHIDRLIQQGIQALLNYEPIYTDTPGHSEDVVVSCANPRLAQDMMTASHWFG
ncbi:hypothetical protein GFS31_14730 [Leptolyngbya sp. BL0902]|uniref:hypothetical protein n=1 Tax=Leptolyngbya sp. BL0902 TaxID=1115757 RepID=UPI0018E89EAA|nr:hypothetical protein [Leptolyngbya sp. BL0902]QQE64791.1 hypothetical protein GFS31_14730 [Leptolyngbya sp. BL0902]